MIVAGRVDELQHQNVCHSFAVLRPLLAVLELAPDTCDEHAVILGCMHPGEYILHHGRGSDNNSNSDINNHKNNSNNSFNNNDYNNNNNNNNNSNDD